MANYSNGTEITYGAAVTRLQDLAESVATLTALVDRLAQLSVESDGKKGKPNKNTILLTGGVPSLATAQKRLFGAIKSFQTAVQNAQEKRACQ